MPLLEHEPKPSLTTPTTLTSRFGISQIPNV